MIRIQYDQIHRNEGQGEDRGSEWSSGGEERSRSKGLIVGRALPHVLLQGAGDGEGHITEGAAKPVHAGLAVGLHVPGQLAALSARVRAELALVRLLARVAPLVHSQVAAVLEDFSAKLATVIPPVAQQLLARLEISR